MKADNSDVEQSKYKLLVVAMVFYKTLLLAKRKDKHTLKLLRGSERDLKLDITSAQINFTNDNSVDCPPKTPSVQIESCKRFKSLCSRPIAFFKSQASQKKEIAEEHSADFCTNRIEFHRTLSLLIRMGFSDKPLQERGNTKRIVSYLFTGVVLNFQQLQSDILLVDFHSF